MAPPAARSALVQPNDLSFHTLTKFFEGLRKVKKDRKKYVERFIDANIVKSSHQAYAVFRLVLPALDRERGNYRLLESKLADVLLKATGIDKKSREANAIRNWKRPGSKGAGDYAAVLKDNIFNTYCMIDPAASPEKLKTLKVGQLNEALDKLAAAEGKTDEQAKILRGLMQVTTPDQMAWIVQIILKNLKINAGEGTIFDAWHHDASSYYNNSGMDLKFIFNEMVDFGNSYNTSIKPGLPVRPQLAQMTSSLKWAFNKMQEKEGKEFVVETKFDGERIQVHRCPDGKVNYYSRRAIEHGERSNYSVLDDMVMRCTTRTCVLDGELIVWNKKKKAFEPFGSLKPLVGAITDNKPGHEELEFNEVDLENAAVTDPDYQAPCVGDCELLYIAFDVLHNGKAATIDRPLRERQRMLEDLVVVDAPREPLCGSAVCGRMVALLPGKTYFNSILCSRIGHTKEDISAMFEEMARIREEGIIVKSLSSPWAPNERFTSSWIKIKPDYMKGVELDPVVIGAWGGKGGRGGHYTQYLLALADKPRASGGEVVSWTSFCRVGSGLSESEREFVHQKLEQLCVDASKHPPPSCYKLTGREKPEVWVTDPRNSVVFQVKADLRTIRSVKFATGYSLRFPLIQEIRNDKTGAMASTVEELQDIVDQARQNAEVDFNEQDGDDGRKRRVTTKRSVRAAKKPRTHQLVPAAQHTDLSQEETVSNALEGCSIVFANYGEYNKKEVEEIVKKLGGETHFMYSPAVTHILAANESGKVRGYKERDLDVIHISWLLDCMRQQRRVPLRPRYYIHMSASSRLANPEVDSLGDSYMSDVDEGDVDNLLRRAVRPGMLGPSELAQELAQQSDFEDSDDEQVAQAQRLLTRRAGGQEAARAVAAYLDAQLAALGMRDPRFSCLRSCIIALLRLGNGKSLVPADSSSSSSSTSSDGGQHSKLLPSIRSLVQQGSAARARLQQLQAASVAAEVSIMGGSIAPVLGESVTHVVGVVLPRGPVEQPGGSPPSAAAVLQPAAAAVEPEVLLRAVSDQAGGAQAVSTLKLGLATGGAHLVTDIWVHHCMEEAERQADSHRGSPTLPSEAGFLLGIAGPANPDEWLWQEFLPKQRPPRTSASAEKTRPSIAAPSRLARQRRGGTAVAAASLRLRKAKAPAGSASPAVSEPVKMEAEGGTSGASSLGLVKAEPEAAGPAAAATTAGAAHVATRKPASRGRGATRVGRAGRKTEAVKEEDEERQEPPAPAIAPPALPTAAANLAPNGAPGSAAYQALPPAAPPVAAAPVAAAPPASAPVAGGGALQQLLQGDVPPAQLLGSLPLPAAVARPQAPVEAAPRAVDASIFNAIFGAGQMGGMAAALAAPPALVPKPMHDAHPAADAFDQPPPAGRPLVLQPLARELPALEQPAGQPAAVEASRGPAATLEPPLEQAAGDGAGKKLSLRERMKAIQAKKLQQEPVADQGLDGES